MFEALRYGHTSAASNNSTKTVCFEFLLRVFSTVCLVLSVSVLIVCVVCLVCVCLCVRSIQTCCQASSWLGAVHVTDERCVLHGVVGGENILGSGAREL